jgi:hypothetical protein
LNGSKTKTPGSSDKCIYLRRNCVDIHWRRKIHAQEMKRHDEKGVTYFSWLLPMSNWCCLANALFIDLFFHCVIGCCKSWKYVEVVCCSDEFDFNLNRVIIIIIIIIIIITSPARNLPSSSSPLHPSHPSTTHLFPPNSIPSFLDRYAIYKAIPQCIRLHI